MSCNIQVGKIKGTTTYMTQYIHYITTKITMLQYSTTRRYRLKFKLLPKYTWLGDIETLQTSDITKLVTTLLSTCFSISRGKKITFFSRHRALDLLNFNFLDNLELTKEWWEQKWGQSKFSRNSGNAIQCVAHCTLPTSPFTILEP